MNPYADLDFPFFLAHELILVEACIFSIFKYLTASIMLSNFCM